MLPVTNYNLNFYVPRMVSIYELATKGTHMKRLACGDCTTKNLGCNLLLLRKKDFLGIPQLVVYVAYTQCFSTSLKRMMTLVTHCLLPQTI